MRDCFETTFCIDASRIMKRDDLNCEDDLSGQPFHARAAGKESR